MFKWIFTILFIVFVGWITYELLSTATSDEEALFYMSFMGFILAFLAFIVSLLTVVLTFHLTRPRIKISRNKSYENATFSYKSYVKYENNYYLLLCYNVENHSNNKTKLRDIYLAYLICPTIKNNLTFKTKNYNIHLPNNIANYKNFWFLESMDNIKESFFIDGLDSKQIYFVFPVPKVRKINFFLLRIKIIGKRLYRNKLVFIRAKNLIEL